MLMDVTEIRPGFYTGNAILQNGTKIYLAFCNEISLFNKVLIQFSNSNQNILEILRKIQRCITTEEGVVQIKQKLLGKYGKYFKDKEQFYSVVDDFYGDKKIYKLINVASNSLSTLNNIFFQCRNTEDLDSFVVAASTSQIYLDDISCPLLFCDRSIFMAMTVTMGKDASSISTNHYGIVRDASSLLGLREPTDNASMMLHSFAAYVSLKKYNKYLQVNNPISAMLDIIKKAGVKIYRSKKELLDDSCLPGQIIGYLDKVQDLGDLDYRKCGGAATIAMHLADLAKLYEVASIVTCVVNKAEALLFTGPQQCIVMAPQESFEVSSQKQCQKLFLKS